MNPDVERLVSHLRATADNVKDAHPLDVSIDKVVIDLRQGANAIQDLAIGAEVALQRRLRYALTEALHEFAMREFEMDALCDWGFEPDENGAWHCLVADIPCPMFLSVRVKL